MAGNTYQLVVDAVYKGADAFRQAQRDLGGLDSTARNAAGGLGGTLAKVGIAAGAAGLAVAGVAVAAKKAWSAIGEGAALNRTAAQFDKLSQSVGSTANIMLGKLRAATHGTISDMQLMSSAADMMRLKLATTEDQVVRLTSVAGTLNWDMQQVILTFANMSTMRLDALGLSVSDVTSKARELELQGMSSQEAFKEAVIQAGEAQKAMLNMGDDAVRQMQRAEAGWQNAMDSFKMGLANVAAESGITGLFADIGYRTGQLGLSDLEKDIKHAAELVAQIPAILEGGKMQMNPGIGFDFRQIAGTAAGAARINAIAQMSDDTQQAIAILELYRSTMQQGSEAATILTQEIDRLNATIAEQERIAAIAAAGGRDITEVYREWATATEVQGEQAESFLKTFSESIGVFTSGNIDARPLISLGEAVEGVGVAAGNMQFSVEAANLSLYQAAAAAGASASELALLGVATGQFTEAEADAALKTAILQEAIKRIASDYAAGTISIQGATDALRQQIATISAMPSLFDEVSQSAQHLAVVTGSGGFADQPWYKPVNKILREDTEEIEKARPSYRAFGAEVNYLAEAHQRMSSAFSKEISGDLADGLIDESGLVNMETANELLFDQARAAGATAGQLAMLGVATGQFTQEQAAAALKAAILSEKIKQIAEAVASGQLGYGDAAGSLASFSEQLNAGAIADVQAGIDGAAAAADRFTGTYNAQLNVENQAAMSAIEDAQVALDNLSGTYTVNIVVTGGVAGVGGGSTTTGGPTPSPDDDNRIGGGKSLSVYGGGSIYPDSSTGGMYTTYNGGSSVNVTVTNYVDGTATPRDHLDDITEDALKRAMNELGGARR